MMRVIARLCLAVAAALTTWAAAWERDERSRRRRLGHGTAVTNHETRRDWRAVAFFLIAAAAGLTAWNSGTTRLLFQGEAAAYVEPAGAFYDDWMGVLSDRPATELRALRDAAERHMREHPEGRAGCPDTYDRLMALNHLLEGAHR